MASRSRLSLVALLATVLCALGCGGEDGSATAEEDNALALANEESPSDLLAENPADEPEDQVSEEEVGAAPSGSARYIIYLQPHPSSTFVSRTNPLYDAVAAYHHRWSFATWRNEAALFPPHCSMTRFFIRHTSDESHMIHVIDDTIRAVGKPFGAPTVGPVDWVTIKGSRQLVRVHLVHVPRYHTFIDSVVAQLGITNARTAVAGYHISLADGKWSTATARSMFNDAQNTIGFRLPTYNRDQFPDNAWDIVLYRARDHVANDLIQIRRWSVNP